MTRFDTDALSAPHTQRHLDAIPQDSPGADMIASMDMDYDDGDGIEAGSVSRSPLEHERDAPTEKKRRNSIRDHRAQMLDAQSQCVPCKLCGGHAVIDDAGVGFGYWIRCENAHDGSKPECTQAGTRISGWAYNVSDLWNRLNATTPATPEAGDLVSRAAVLAIAERAELDFADPAWTLEKLRALPAAAQGQEGAVPVLDRARRRLETMADDMAAGRCDGGLLAARHLKRAIPGIFEVDPDTAAQPVAQEPVAWVIPGDRDNAPLSGFIDAMAWEEGEFSQPLYAHPATPASTGAGVALEHLQNVMGHIDTPIGRRRLLVHPGQPGWLTDARDFLRAQSAPVGGEGGGK